MAGFLDLLAPEHRRRLHAGGRLVRLAQGERLVEQGAPGGEAIWLVEKGRLEVVDRRASPEVVLDVLGPGAVVGELAFVDGAPHSAEVRALEPVTCRAWDRGDLLAAASAEPRFAADLWRAVATVAVERVRRLSATAVSGALGPVVAAPAGEVADEAHRRTAAIAQGWMEAEAELRAGRTAAAAEVAQGLGALVRAARDWMEALADEAERRAAGRALATEVRPLLLRARTAALAAEEAARSLGLVAHVVLGRASGDGLFGEALDAAILDLPTCAAYRVRTRVLADSVARALQGRAGVRVALVPVGTGALLARVVQPLARAGAELWCLDDRRDALAFADAGLSARPSTVTLRFSLAELARPADALAPLPADGVDAIVLDGIADHLPDRLLAELLREAVRRLRPGGRLWASGLLDALDAPFLDDVLGWPLARRPPGELRALVATCGLSAEAVEGSAGAGAPFEVASGVRSPALTSP